MKLFKYLRLKLRPNKYPCDECLVGMICTKSGPTMCQACDQFWEELTYTDDCEETIKQMVIYYKNNPQVIGDKLLYILFLLSASLFYGTCIYVIVQSIRIKLR